MVTPAVADLVVVGFGGAGAAAAITAHDAGADVLVLEKTGRGGGSTEVSGGHTWRLRDRDRAVRHFRAVADGAADPDVIDAYVDGLAELPGWLERIGVRLEEHHQSSNEPLRVTKPTSVFVDYEDADGFGIRVRPERPEGTTGGEALWAALEAAVNERGIAVRTNSPARELVRDPSGRITGVRVVSGEEFTARRAVILACGGFAWDPELQHDNLGVALPSYAPPHANTGDGVRMAQQVGAGLHHMNAVAARLGFTVPGFEAPFMAVPTGHSVYLVDKHGRRYINECEYDIHSAALGSIQRDTKTGEFNRMPSHMIFDRRTLEGGPLCGQWGSGFNRHVEWSADNSVEIKRGWIPTADSIVELAAVVGVDPEELLATNEAFNRAAEADDDPFGRPASMMAPVIEPPFGALTVLPCLLNTQGGPRRNASGQVLDAFGAPIAGLYSAGELGSLWGQLYPGAGNLSEALITGWTAARTALAGRVALSSSSARRCRPDDADRRG